MKIFIKYNSFQVGADLVSARNKKKRNPVMIILGLNRRK